MILPEKRDAILSILRFEPQLAQREIAHKAGVSVGTVNALLHQFTEEGLLRNEGSVKRPTYVVTPKGLVQTINASYHRAAEALRELSLLKRGIQVEVLKEYARGGRVVNIVGDGELASVAETTVRSLGLPDLRCERHSASCEPPREGLTLVDAPQRKPGHGASVRLLGELAGVAPLEAELR